MGAKEKPDAVEVAAEKSKGKRKKKAKKRLSRKDKESIQVTALFEDLRKGLGPRAAKLAKTRRVFLLRNVRTTQVAIFGAECAAASATRSTSSRGESRAHSEEPEAAEALDSTAAETKGNRKVAPVEFAADVFATKLRELKGGGRAVKTRNLQTAETDVLLDRTAQLTHLLLGVHEALCKIRDEESGRVRALFSSENIQASFTTARVCRRHTCECVLLTRELMLCLAIRF